MSNPTSAPAGFTLVTGTITTGGNPVPGTITFTPVLNSLVPSAFNANGTQIETDDTVSAPLASDGTFAVVLADCQLTNPINMAYHVRVYTAANKEVLGLAYKTISPTGAAWSLNTQPPNLLPQVPVVQGKKGDAGAPGANGSLTGIVTGNLGVTGDVLDEGTYFIAGGSAYKEVWGAANGDIAFALTGAGIIGSNFNATADAVTGIAYSPGIAIDDSTLFVASHKAGTLLEVWGAANGDIAFALTAQGFKGVDTSALLNKIDGLTYFAGRLVDDSTFFLSSNPQGYLEVWGAANGDVAFAISPIGGIGAYSPAASDVRSITNPSFFTQIVAGLSQVFRADVGFASVQLTTSGNNIFTGVSLDGRFVNFLSDRGGTSVAYYMSPYGLNQFPVTVDVTKLFDLNHHGVTGQSNSNGAVNHQAVTTVQPYANLSFNIGDRLVDNNDSNAAITSGSLASFIPLVEIPSASGNGGETMGATASNFTTAALMDVGIRHTVLSSINSVGLTVYAGLCKGTQPYANGIAAVNAAKSLFASYGFASYGFRTYSVVHGESDEAARNTSYAANMLQWWSDYNADISTITGQSLSIPMLHSQISCAWFFTLAAQNGTGADYPSIIIPKPNLMPVSTTPASSSWCALSIFCLTAPVVALLRFI